MEHTPRRLRYLALTQALASGIQGDVAHYWPDALKINRFVRDDLIANLRKFTRTDDEFRFMTAKLLESFAAMIVNEAAHELFRQELMTPAEIYGEGVERTTEIEID